MRRGVGDRDRPVREGVRRDRHERECGHLRIEDRAAGRQRIRGRPGGGGHDDPVGAHRIDEAAVDLHGAIDHRAAAAAVQDDVVHRERDFHAAGPHDLRREQRAALLDVAAFEHRREDFLHARDRNVREKAQPALVDPDERHVERRQAPRDREHRAVATEDNRHVGMRPEVRRRRGREIGQAGRACRVGLDHHVVTCGDKKRSETRQRLRDVGAHVATDQRHPAETGGGRRRGGGGYHRPD